MDTTLTTDDLRAQLQALRDQQFPLPSPQLVRDLTGPMLAHVGSPDAHLRDGLIYATFVRWIEIQRVYDPAQLRQLLATCLDDQHLGLRLGELTGDAVFVRSFSMLLVPLVLAVHREQPFLQPAEVRHVLQQVLHSLAAEQDVRGFVSPEAGWVHALAHTADALSELALCAELTPDDLQTILTAIRAKLMSLTTALTHAEDRRLVNAVDSVVERGLLRDEWLCAWVEGFRCAICDPPEAYAQCINCNHFLLGLFFHGHMHAFPTVVQDAVQAVLVDLAERL